MYGGESPHREVKKLHEVTQLGGDRAGSQVEVQVPCVCMCSFRTPCTGLQIGKGLGGSCPPLIPHHPQVSLKKAEAKEGKRGLVFSLLSGSMASILPFPQTGGSQ